MLLEIKKLSVRVKSSGLKAVDGIDLSVNAGEPLLILGQSGSGKTMICRALFGLTDRYDFDVSGQIVFEGEDILSADAKKRRKLYGSDIALIPQNPMTAFDLPAKLGISLRKHTDFIIKAVPKQPEMLFLKRCKGQDWKTAKRCGQAIHTCFQAECCKGQLWRQRL